MSMHGSMHQEQVELVRDMLAKYLAHPNKFDKFMKKFDKDESKTLDKREWEQILAKIKKKHEYQWELTSDLSGVCFELAQAYETNGKSKELKFSTVRNWITKSKILQHQALSADIASWGRKDSADALSTSKDKGAVMNAVSKNGLALQHASSELTKDKEVVMAAVPGLRCLTSVLH